jgi:cytochrome d ubiquinol oxidase subunit II
METIWFCIVAVMLAAYVLLDGFDLGAGIIHLLVARNDRERREIFATIGPVWDGNEVWLLAAGGVLYFAFPGLYAAGFSGFYLALMVVLWLLMLRGLAIELRSHLAGSLWGQFFDVVFSGASILLAIFYGAALGNVVRGVPLNADGYFFVPFWTDFSATAATPGIIDWYTVLIGVTALLVLMMHGALWVAVRTGGDVQARSRTIASRAFWVVCALVLIISVVSFRVQPLLYRSFTERSWTWVFPVIAAAGLLALRLCLNMKGDLLAFIGSATFIVGLLCSAAFGLYPDVLPAVGDASRSLTIHNVAAAPYGLRIGFFWWVPSFLLALAYSTFIYRQFRGKVHVEDVAPKTDPVPINFGG